MTLHPDNGGSKHLWRLSVSTRPHGAVSHLTNIPDSLKSHQGNILLVDIVSDTEEFRTRKLPSASEADSDWGNVNLLSTLQVSPTEVFYENIIY
jgi:hypothetical protein